MVTFECRGLPWNWYFIWSLSSFPRGVFPDFFPLSFSMATSEGPAPDSMYSASKGVVSVVDYKSIHVSCNPKDEIHFKWSIKHIMNFISWHNWSFDLGHLVSSGPEGQTYSEGMLFGRANRVGALGDFLRLNFDNSEVSECRGPKLSTWVKVWFQIWAHLDRFRRIRRSRARELSGDGSLEQ